MTKKIITTDIDKNIIKLADKIAALDSVKDSAFYRNQLTNIKSEIRHKEFRITVVGEFSSGKSTFLNALIGRDILPHAVKETTATITYIHNVPKGNEMENKGVVHFNEDGRKDETLDIVTEKQKFQDYLSALNQNGNNIVKLVKSVDVYVNFSDIDEPIVFVDTPGLNGVADGHRDITIREISRSHASICLFPIRGIGQTDLTFMKELMKYQNTFFFVINQIDMLKSQEEVAKERIAMFKEEVKQNIYDGKVNPEYVFGISGLKALVSRDRQIEYLDDDDKENGICITDDDRQRYWEESRFELLEESIFKYLASNDKDRQFYQSITLQMESILDDVEERGREIKDIHEADPKELREETWLRNELKKLLDNTDKNKLQQKNAVGSEMDDLDKNLRAAIRKDCENQMQTFNNRIDELTNVPSIKTFSISKAATIFYANECTKIENGISDGCKTILKHRFEEIDELMPKFKFKKDNVNNEELSVNVKEENIQAYNNDEIAKLERQKKDLGNKIDTMQADTKQMQHNIDDWSANRRTLETQCQNEIRKADRQKRTWTERVWVGTRPVKQSGVGGFLKRFFTFGCCGYDEEDIYENRTFNNYDEVEREKNDIENKYRPKISELRNQISTYQTMIDTNLGNLAKIERKKAQTERDLANARQEQEDQIKYATSSWIREQKRSLKSQVAKLFENGGEIYDKLADAIRKNLATCKPQIIANVENYYNEKCKQYKKNITEVINKIHGESDIAKTERMIEKIDCELRAIAGLRNEITNINTLI